MQRLGSNLYRWVVRVVDKIKKLVLPAPAKLNLFLHITGKREDGYHLLQTVFQILDYADEITLELRQNGTITRSLNSDAEKNNISYESDLCVRAAKLIQSKLPKKKSEALGVEIKLLKRLPIGGGIGGGSSNAATVLCGLNKLWECGFTNDQLAILGAELGADVPVFVRGFTAWAEGIGEQLTPFKLDQKWFVVIHPNIFASTAEIFTNQALTRDCDTLKIARFLEGNQFDYLSEEFSNVFESVVTKQYPEITNVIDWLSIYSPARLTGTGSCVFASFDNEVEAIKVLNALEESNHNWLGFIAKGVDQSPLQQVLQN